MARTRTVHRCNECGATAPQWAGRCNECGEWNTLVAESEAARSGAGASLPPAGVAMPMVDVVDLGDQIQSTGVAEFDRVLGGGLVPASVTLVGGEPGIGKSTLLLQVLGRSAAAGRRCLYISGEESAGQVRSRASRVDALDPNLWLVSETVLPHILTHIDQVKPEVVVVDSVQTLNDPALSSAPGSVTQVRECVNILVAEAKRRGVVVLLVGHVTKEGTLAGPRVLEHVVDTVLAFEGDRHHELRIVRAVKHRYGPTSEVGVLRMGEHGLVAVDDPSQMFLADRVPGISGSAVVATVDGHRPILAEVQALVAPSSLGTPRRSAQGIDQGRLALLLAVLERRVGVPIGRNDVYALAVGGVRIADPGADAAVALAVMSSLCNMAIPDDLIVIGEVGLGGELRQVAHMGRRLNEAARLGFRRAIIPKVDVSAPSGMTLFKAPTLHAAVKLADLEARVELADLESRGELASTEPGW